MELLFIDAAVKATVLLAAAALTTFALGRASAASRHLIWTVALFAALALPVLSLALPRWQLPVVTLAPPVHSGSAEGGLDAASAAMARKLQPRASDANPSAPAPRDVPAAAAAAPASQSWTDVTNISWPAVALFVWLAGAGLILGRLALGIVAVQIMSRTTQRVSSGAWIDLATSLAASLDIAHITFRRSLKARMPMAWGVFRPSVVMPAEADGWPLDRLRIVLLHELAHVKRRDCLTHMLAQVTCAVYWMNPLVWMAAKHVRAERERACDDLVLAAGTRGVDYADQLLEIARAMSSGRFPGVAAGASLAMAHRSQLEGRLMAILDPTVPRSGVSCLRTTAAAAVALAALLPLASVQAWTYRVEAAALQQPSAAANSIQPLPIVQPPVRSAPRTPVDAAAKARGTTQNVAEAVTRSVVQSLAYVGNQNPNPNPNPNPKPVVAGKYDDGRRREKADPKLIAALTEALKDTDKDVRETAMHALVQMRDPSIFQPLIAALKDAAPDIRQQAAFGLGEMRDIRAVEPLIGALKDSVADVRQQAAFALGQLRDPAAAEALGGALRDTDAEVREQVVFALGQLRDQKSVEPLISALKDPQRNVREQAAFALGQLRSGRAVEALVVALKDEDAEVRAQAAFALGQIRDPRAIDGLTTALKDPSSNVRQQAAFALGQLAR
jgi:beta-lactamase regulating signal transducer with metallopeptidase domain